MNVFAHVAVAARARPAAPGGGDRFLLGAALSDLATYGGFRLLGDTPDPDIGAGMAFHHRSDDAFHRHPWFRVRNREASDGLEARGLGRGAARACAHVGIELLLDGALHGGTADRDRFQRVLAAAGAAVPELAPLVDRPRRQAWSAHLEELARPRPLPDYDDPVAIARRLHRICGRRPRLAFDEARIGDVADVLSALAPSIRTTGPDLVEELAVQLAPPG